MAFLDENFQLGGPQMTLINDTVLIVATNQAPNRKTANEGEIITLSIPGEDMAIINGFGVKGRNPQIQRAGNENIITFIKEITDSVSSAVDQMASSLDIYLMTVDNEGIYKRGLSGYLGFTERNIQNYKLVADKNALGMNQLAVLWHEPVSVFDPIDTDKYTLHDRLFAARLGRWDGELFTSAPVEIVTAPENHRISSYDAISNNTDLKALVSISNRQSGAGIVEKTATFSNYVEVTGVSYPENQIEPGAKVPITFQVENRGYAPIIGLEVMINDSTDFVETEIMPGKSDAVTGYYYVPEGNVGVSYTMVPTFAQDNMLRTSTPISSKYTGIRALTSVMESSEDVIPELGRINMRPMVDMAISERYNSTGEETTSILLEVVNVSPFKLQEEKVTVGLYKDAFAKELYPDTEVKEVPLSELYDSEAGMNSSTLMAFNVPTVRAIERIYAIVSTTTAEGEAIEDIETLNNYVIVTLYPNPNRVAILTEELPKGKVDEAYNATLNAGGQGPFFWSITDGALPDGLALDTETGVISGVPTRMGTFHFTVKSTNNNSSDTIETSIAIDPRTGIDDVSTEKGLKVEQVKDGIFVTGLTLGTNVSLYDAQGRVLFQQDEIAGDGLFIPLTEKAVYLLVNDTESVKVVYSF
ncbi:Ig domain-containing protein [Bacteroidales bacterium OttesenSCG-928-A17]|nr:Ig domain-containing protein [Bacteroidales bacterium OttesenSCG-928-A17]